MSDTYDRDPDDIEDDIPDDVNEDQDDNQPEDDEDDLEVSIEGEAPPNEREGERVLRARVKELQEQLRQSREPQPEIIDPGPKPTLSSCDYDEERLEQELDSWKDKDREAKAQREAIESKKAAAPVIDWKAQERRYLESKEALKDHKKDLDAADLLVSATFTPSQIAALVAGVKDPAKVTLALGKNPTKLSELSKIINPYELAGELRLLEGKITMKSRRQSVDVDEPVRGGARTSVAKGALEKRLEKAEADFAKRGGGNRDEIRAIQRQIKERDSRK